MYCYSNLFFGEHAGFIHKKCASMEILATPVDTVIPNTESTAGIILLKSEKSRDKFGQPFKRR
jgi:hypothetical protein